MKLFMTSLLIAAIVALAPLAGAEAGLREGRAAYAQGDYATALEEILPLAEAGNADAQRLLGVTYRHRAKGSPRTRSVRSIGRNRPSHKVTLRPSSISPTSMRPAIRWRGI